MGLIRRQVLACVLAGVTGVSGFSAPGIAAGEYDEEPTGAEMLADALVVRPLSLTAAVIGGAAWLVSLPFTIVGGNTGEAGQKMVVDPLRYTFVRPLGHMEKGTPPAYASD